MSLSCSMAPQGQETCVGYRRAPHPPGTSILQVKTGLGGIHYQGLVTCDVIVTDSEGSTTTNTLEKPEYFWPHQITQKSVRFRELIRKESELFEKRGALMKMPSTFRNIEAIYDFVEPANLGGLISLSEQEEKSWISMKCLSISRYFYTAKVWGPFNEDIGLRKGQSVLSAGIQLAANNMPQGETIQIPLTRNIGRQNQMHLVCHFSNARSDLGRKGFQREFTEFAKGIAD